MNESHIKKGRVNQKLQTRSEIIYAAKLLMHKKSKLTLEDIANKAGVSRATMYRYYSNIDLLMAEASLDIQHKSPDEIYEDIKDYPLEKRILHIQDYYNKLALKNEIAFRRYLVAVLSESIASKKHYRGARRTQVLEMALEPYGKELDKESMQKLISISSVLMGIDSLIICKDVCKLNNKESNDTLQWAMKMILKGMSNELK